MPTAARSHNRRRAEDRARARARRTCACPGCREPLDAQRSTKRYCSTACRVKAHRAKGLRPRKAGLRPAQVRILEVLGEKSPLPPDLIAEREILQSRVARPLGEAGKLEQLDEARFKTMPGVVAVVRDGSFLGVIAEREEQAIRASVSLSETAKWAAGPPLNTVQ